MILFWSGDKRSIGKPATIQPHAGNHGIRPFSGLKARFYQPSPKGWVTASPRQAALKGRFIMLVIETPLQGFKTIL